MVSADPKIAAASGEGRVNSGKTPIQDLGLPVSALGSVLYQEVVFLEKCFRTMALFLILARN